MKEKLTQASSILTRDAEVTLSGEKFMLLCQLIGMTLQEVEQKEKTQPVVNGEVKEAKK